MAYKINRTFFPARNYSHSVEISDDDEESSSYEYPNEE